ncbi:S9 family peptidase [Massilia sp. TS11]|uniref:alpha/beta hydrolase family protein n=1 Tax=Massilia sp. TS11 TaxID=2908003 RepID=UPI001ED9CAF0|nr:alpha/beta fold hydrolase [Massilia sp. TS11]MCG2585310.1 prolyl oligopeptidase family serine peptidase [Massilia sp. TS11]
MSLSRLLLAVCAAVLLSAPAIRPAQAAAPAIEAIFANPKFGTPSLSPDGRYVAVRMAQGDGRDGLAVLDLQAMALRIVARFGNMDVGDYQWVAPDRLVFDITDKRVGIGEAMGAPGLYGVNADGSDFRHLVAHDTNNESEAVQGFKLKARNKLTWNHYLLDLPGIAKGGEVYLQKPEFDGLDAVKFVDLVKLDTRSGRSTTVNRPYFIQDWVLDATGEPRLAISLENGERKVHLRNEDGSWRQISAFDAFVGGKGFRPIGADARTVYVTMARGSDKGALFAYDIASGKLSEQAVVRLKDFDFRGELVYGQGRVLGVRFVADAPSTEWFDAGLQALQKTVDGLLPGTINQIAVPSEGSAPWVLIDSFADALPHRFYVYNRETKALSKLGDSLPGIDPASLGRTQMVRYTARDGREIPGWLTLPRSKAAGTRLPLVVLVHGGPWLRGAAWEFDPEVQFLASRGYAVLQPEFRGSTGYGYEHFRAGWKQWGLKMQDDIADGARWAIEKGYADAARICIAGASYGGYASLMGLVNDPDLYKCGVSWAGVTDIQLMYTGHWSRQSDLSAAYRQYGMPQLVGDPVKDAAQLAATSPVQQAARIKAPLLLAYGGSDLRVPIYHGKQFYEAVKAVNPQVSWVVYPEEGHGWSLPKNRYDFWGRVEQFLAAQIGTPAP